MDDHSDSSGPDRSLLDQAGLDALLRAAGKAPSPDNNQPWAFEATATLIRIYHLREKAVLSDVRDLFSWLAIGAAVENTVLEAGRRGLSANVEFHLPVKASGPGELVATVALRPAGEPDPLAEQIEARHTNRLPHSAEAVPAESLAGIEAAIAGSSCEILWTTGRPSIRKMSSLVSVADRVRFEDRRFHDELHRMIRYTEEEVASCRDGLDIRSLEIPRPLWSVLRFLRPWGRMRVANAFGASRSFARISAKQARSTGALGLLVTGDDSDRGYLEAGRALQRVWLAASAANLAFHTLGSLPLFLLKLRTDSSTFLPKHVLRLETVARDLAELLPGIRERTPVMLFRLGGQKGGKPHPSVRYDLAAVRYGS